MVVTGHVMGGQSHSFCLSCFPHIEMGILIPGQQEEDYFFLNPYPEYFITDFREGGRERERERKIN